MPMICEICGSAEEAEDTMLSQAHEHLHVCKGCMQERPLPEFFLPEHRSDT